MMKTHKVMSFFAALILSASFAVAQQQPLVIQASSLLDGKGHALKSTRIVIEGSKIARIDPKAGPVTYNLTGLTVMPGLIDVHIHLTYHFGPSGRYGDRQETPQQAELAIMSNAWLTLMSGFTTVQSVGAPADRDVREAIAKGTIPGPRILTALRPLMGRGPDTGTPDQIREFVRQQKEQGADLLKIFASKSIRDGGGMTLSQEQLNAACDEAKKLGLRSLVHAYGPAVRASVLAGCTQVEHGTYATDDDLKLMAEHGVIFDPQAGLVIENYLQYKAKYLGVGNFNEEGFAFMEKAMPEDHALVRRAFATPNLKVVFGTDAVAGAHGRNAEEIIDRVRDCGQDPMAALVSAHSLAAETLGLQNEIGSIAPGMNADIIALAGDPLKDITAVRRVVFVMRNGIVYKNVAPTDLPQYAGVTP